MNYFNVPEDIVYKPMAFWNLCKVHAENYNRDGLRFGQRFWNTYGPDGKSCPEIYYEPDTNKAKTLVRQLLESNGYNEGVLPPTVKEIREYHEENETESH